jgi:hypothetical protein
MDFSNIKVLTIFDSSWDKDKDRGKGGVGKVDKGGEEEEGIEEEGGDMREELDVWVGGLSDDI